MVFLIKLLGNSADKNFLIMRFNSKLKSLAILLALCDLLAMALHFFMVGTFEEQCTGSF